MIHRLPLRRALAFAVPIIVMPFYQLTACGGKAGTSSGHAMGTGGSEPAPETGGSTATGGADPSGAGGAGVGGADTIMCSGDDEYDCCLALREEAYDRFREPDLKPSPPECLEDEDCFFASGEGICFVDCQYVTSAAQIDFAENAQIACAPFEAAGCSERLFRRPCVAWTAACVEGMCTQY